MHTNLWRTLQKNVQIEKFMWTGVEYTLKDVGVLFFRIKEDVNDELIIMN